MLHRDVGERLRTLAPFLRWDADPQTTVIGGRVAVPVPRLHDEQPLPVLGAGPRRRPPRQLRARPGVQATVDAFSGRVELYADRRRRIRSCARGGRRFPDLFLPCCADAGRAARAPALPAPAVRGPGRGLRDLPRRATRPAFWNGADAWQRPQQLAGPVEGAGEIQLPGPGGRRADERARRAHADARDATPLPARAAARATRASASCSSRRSRRAAGENLVAYLAGSIDDARPAAARRCSACRATGSRSARAQATRRILASPAVSRRLELLNRESRDLGKAAVDRTILGVAAGGAGRRRARARPAGLPRRGRRAACRGCSS